LWSFPHCSARSRMTSLITSRRRREPLDAAAGGEGGLDAVPVLLAGEVDGDGLAGVGGLAVARCSGDGPSCVGPRWAARRDRRGRWVPGRRKELAGRSRPPGRRRSRGLACLGVLRALSGLDGLRGFGGLGSQVLAARTVDVAGSTLGGCGCLCSSCAPGGGARLMVWRRRRRPLRVVQRSSRTAATARAPSVPTSWIGRPLPAASARRRRARDRPRQRCRHRRPAARSRGRRAPWFAALG